MTTPAHGTTANWAEHMQQSDEDLTVTAVGNHQLRYPARVSPSTERAPQFYERINAEPNPRRRGPRQSEEQALQRDPSIQATFDYGFHVDRAAAAPQYDAKFGDGNRSPLATGADGGPAWDRVPREALASFAQDHDVMPDRRERVSSTYEKIIAPPNGGRRYNNANIRNGGRA